MEIITAKGRNGSLKFNGRALTIIREGFIARSLVGSGERTIPLDQLAGMDWKRAGLGLGFIRLIVPGTAQARSRVGQRPTDAQRDPNAVTFTRKQMAAFEALRAAVESAQVTAP
jgi:hypothetical protein